MPTQMQAERNSDLEPYPAAIRAAKARYLAKMLGDKRFKTGSGEPVVIGSSLVNRVAATSRRRSAARS